MSSACDGPSNPVEPGIEPCTIKAWVRAPDLDPGKIIPGQVRIQANGSCESIVEYSLILRLKERVWVKVLKPDVILPEKPTRRQPSNARNSVFGSHPGRLNESPMWQEYIKEMRNEALWTVAEEERVAFESRFKLFDGSMPEHQLIRDFALLVPTTNYPPSERISFGNSVPGEPTSERGHEHIYMYTVEAKFLDGTTIEVPAGYSAFNTLSPYPQTQSHNNPPEVVTFKASFAESGSSRDPLPNPLDLWFDFSVTFPLGRTLEQGTNHSLTFTLLDALGPISDGNRNYNITFTPPHVTLGLSSEACMMQRLSLGNKILIPSTGQTRSQLSPTTTESEVWGHRSYQKNGFSEPNWNTTTSKSFNVGPAFPSFDMYYQSLESQLRIILCIRLENVDQDDDEDALDEDYYWTPATRRRQHSKKSKLFEPFRTSIPITIYPKAKQDFHVTHYLSPDARQPVFVDPSTTSELLELSVEERDLLAPKSIPIFKKITDDIVRQRYYSPSLHYVGDTWLRKVVNGGPKVQEGHGIETYPC